MVTEHHNGYQKILVVDDHEASGQHTVTMLSRLDGATRWTLTGKKALRVAGEWLPDLIFMDICLPDMDGLEVIRLIQQAWPSLHPRPEFVVLTGGDPRLRQDELDRLGIEHALTKPVSGQQIKALAAPGHEKNTPSMEREQLLSKLGVLFKGELEQRLPQLDLYLKSNRWEKAIALVHQFIASSAMTEEIRLESQFRLLNGLLRNKASYANLARTYYRTLEAAHEYLHRAG